MSELKFKLESDDSKKLSIICGPVNSNLSKIEDSLSIKIKNRGSLFSLSGEDQNITKGRLVIEELFSFADQSKDISPKEIHFFISKALNQPNESRNFKLESKSAFSLTTPKLEVIPRNQSQEDFINSISSHDISFGIGPAGTGKTYLAVAVAVNLFIQRKINKIILTRPLVEAGERLGFLPGDLAQKFDIKAPSINLRIKSLKQLTSLGWQIGLRFDPLIYNDNWKISYNELIRTILDEINTNYLHSVSFGSLRFPKQIFNTINNMYPGDELFSHNFKKRDNVYSYKDEVEKEMISYCKNLIHKKVKKDIQIFSCTPY